MRPDPGGNFASDDHRRVMGGLPAPDDDPRTEGELFDGPVWRDDFLDLDEDELDEILKDLEADGDAKHLKNGWKMTKAGHDALTGPPVEEGGRKHGN